MSANKKNIADLCQIMAALRHPQTGCLWDLKQDFTTILPYTIEEAYEVGDAIERQDFDDLKDELGDLLFQVVYHGQLADELGEFDFSDIVDGIAAKMIRRHPHVFGDLDLANEAEVKQIWDKIKAEEKNLKRDKKAAKQQGDQTESILSDVPKALPALTRATKLQDKAAKVGFDWPDIRPVLAKFHEEITEFEDELNADTPDTQAVAEEFGDILFVLANIARHLHINPEQALRNANQKFINRFHYIEQQVKRQNRKLASVSLKDMDCLWDEAKHDEAKHKEKSEK